MSDIDAVNDTTPLPIMDREGDSPGWSLLLVGGLIVGLLLCAALILIAS